jgi:predicted NAD-dependent protein-ADP-ribosyltransferase YbiA (DUF1768 family)
MPPADDGEAAVRFYDQKKAFGELSNYWELAVPIKHNGKTYATSEHLYQALKYDYDGAPAANAAHAEMIRTASTPAIAKALSNPDVPGHWKWQQRYANEARLYRQFGSVIDPHWLDAPAKAYESDNSPLQHWEKTYGVQQCHRNKAMLTALRAKFTQWSHGRRVLMNTGHKKLIEASPSDAYWGIGHEGHGLNMLGRMLESVREDLHKSSENK